MERSIDKIYGHCPTGHNPQPRGTVAADTSTNEIPENEGRQLFWSNYYQAYVCKMCLVDAENLKYDDRMHEKRLEVQRKLSGMGIQQS